MKLPAQTIQSGRFLHAIDILMHIHVSVSRVIGEEVPGQSVDIFGGLISHERQDNPAAPLVEQNRLCGALQVIRQSESEFFKRRIQTIGHEVSTSRQRRNAAVASGEQIRHLFGVFERALHDGKSISDGMSGFRRTVSEGLPAFVDTGQ